LVAIDYNGTLKKDALLNCLARRRGADAESEFGQLSAYESSRKRWMRCRSDRLGELGM